MVLKTHPSHPLTSLRAHAAVATSGLPAALQLVHGFDAGVTLVQHPDIRAVGFTGSLEGGRALRRLVDQPPAPVPFFGELSSVNALLVTPSAAAERATEIGADLVASFTLGNGQFCTKPGVVFVPTGAEGDQLVATARDTLRRVPARPMLNDAIRDAYQSSVAQRSSARQTCDPPRVTPSGS